MISRRQLIVGAGGLGVGGAIAWAGLTRGQDDRGLALVYRGPASCAGCSESAARLLRECSLRVEYCGPDEARGVTADNLAGALAYAQPGGGALRQAWRHTRDYAPVIREYVAGGGSYLGFCLGGYLAGNDSGFGLFPGSVRQYIGTADATISTTRDTVVELDWRGERRSLYFQDGTAFFVPNDDWSAVGGQVLTCYRNGVAAAVVTPYGAGRVGLVGPHPEADEKWYRGAGLPQPDRYADDLGRDLIETTLAR